jgi:hypothetical protein
VDPILKETQRRGRQSTTPLVHRALLVLLPITGETTWLTCALYGALHTRQENRGWRHRPQIRSPAVRRADASSGRGGVVPAPLPQLGADVDLAERRSQQARAQEHEAGRGQGKKSVGDNVVVAHDTPTTQMLVRIY